MDAETFNPPCHPTARIELDDSSSPACSAGTESMDWHSTPPDSPQSTIRKAPHATLPSINSGLARMSLDFITESVPSQSAVPTPSSLARNSPEEDTPTSIPRVPLQLPGIESLQLVTTNNPTLPNWSTSNNILLFIPPNAPSTNLSRRHRRERSSPIFSRQRLQILVPNRVPARPTRHHTTRGQSQREDRHPYDPEEIYAMMCLRDGGDRRWADVLECFHRLFPIGQPRRFKVSTGARTGAAQHGNLPPVYTNRNIQGLQCRWYRVRERHGLPKLRAGESNKDPAARRREEKPILDEMERSGELSEAFLRMVKDIGKGSKKALAKL